MKKGSGLLIVILCCLLLEGFSQSAICSYKYRKRITFDPTKVNGTNDLLNFPVLINIAADNDLRTVGNSGHVENANGFDIIFVAVDGVTKLDHQLERYTATTGELVAWVRIPNLSTSINTYIYMYYGNTAIAADQSVNTTWHSGYKGVWHLNNNVFTDGTSTGNNATNSGSTNMAAAKIAGGRTFSGVGANYVQLPLTGVSGGSGNGSVSLWGRVTTFVNSTYFFGESTTPAYANRVQLYLNGVGGDLALGLGGSHVVVANVQTLLINTWNHISLTWATTGVGVGTYSIFVNGVQRNSGAYAAFTAIHTFADLGNDGNAAARNEQITGNIDEAHITNTTLSADWIITEYNNQNSPSTFYTISAEPKVWNGGTSSNYNTTTNWLNSSAPVSGNDVIINNGTNQPTLQGNEQVNSIFIRTGSNLSLGANNLSVLSDISNCGTITGNTGLVNLNSGAANTQTQYISGSGTNNFNNLTVNNTFASNPSVVLNKDVNVAGALVLTSGIVYTSATNILALGTGATSTSGSANSFISGPISKAGSANFVFPIGKGTRWRRAAVTNLTGSATFTGEYFNVAYTNTSSINAPLDNISHVEYWQVDQTAGSVNANLSLYWENAGTSGIDDCLDLTIARWNGASWDERLGSTVAGSSCSGAGTGTITTAAVLTAFSPFTFGSRLNSINPLPIELMEFTASCSEISIHLNWSTASERNNEYFILERSDDGINWTDIQHVPGAKNSAITNKYAYDDHYDTKGIIYYRLSQVDIGGKPTINKVITLNCMTGVDQIKVYPNPSGPELYIEVGLIQNQGEGELRIMDNLGRICFQQPLRLSKGKNVLKIVHDLSMGAYSLQLSSENLVFPAQKLIVK